jgi:oligoendopeptidase F
MTAVVGGKPIGLAQASGMLKSSDSELRKTAYIGLQAAWDDKKEICTSILNGLGGWRHTVNERRGSTHQKHFLFDPLHQSRLEHGTLDVMHQTINDRKNIGHKALKLQAKVLNKERLDPWDLLGGYPNSDSKETLSWDHGVEIISEAFGEVSGDMKNFVHMMADQKLIEATAGNKKRLGAYCSGFLKSRTPIVFMTWQGSQGDLSTLAHELGHAWHTWVMRDLSIDQSRYPSTLAETASIFSETLVADSLLKRAKSEKSKLAIHWDRAESAGSFLLNIPARFRFEESFMNSRAKGILTTSEIVSLNTAAWQESYGDTLSSYDPLYWASKLHFYMWGRSFYNYPYTFGYLFALGVYATYLQNPSGFSNRYNALLRDTGLMSCEELALKHLGADIRSPNFWNSSLDIIERQMLEFESALAAH